MIEFNSISKHYDLLNHVLSFGVDRYWRFRLMNHIFRGPNKKILDMAAGTLDITIALAKNFPEREIIAGDIAEEMLEIGKKKIENKKIRHQIKTQVIDAQDIPYPDNTFDTVTIAYGIRNVQDRDKALREMYRVLAPGGQLCILEFSPVKKPKLFAMFYHWYLDNIAPRIAKLITKDDQAYKYLSESVKNFPDAEDFCEQIQNAGFDYILNRKMTFGITHLYVAVKS